MFCKISDAPCPLVCGVQGLHALDSRVCLDHYLYALQGAPNAAKDLSRAFWSLFVSTPFARADATYSPTVTIAVDVQSLDFYAAFLALDSHWPSDRGKVQFLSMFDDEAAKRADLKMKLHPKSDRLVLDGFDPFRPPPSSATRGPDAAAAPVTSLCPEIGFDLPITADALHRFVTSIDHFLRHLRTGDPTSTNRGLKHAIEVQIEERTDIFPPKPDPAGNTFTLGARVGNQSSGIPLYDVYVSLKESEATKQAIWVSVFLFSYSSLKIGGCTSVYMRFAADSILELLYQSPPNVSLGSERICCMKTQGFWIPGGATKDTGYLKIFAYTKYADMSFVAHEYSPRDLANAQTLSGRPQQLDQDAHDILVCELVQVPSARPVALQAGVQNMAIS